MKKKSKKLIWLTYPGQTLYESLNPYWIFCERSLTTPESIAIIHDNEDDITKIKKAFTIISQEFEPNKKINIKSISYDDEDVNGFKNTIQFIFDEAINDKAKLIVDISPTTSWSFVPVFLSKISQENKKMVNSLIYLQYSNHSLRSRPYPLIPGMGITLHDILPDLSEMKGKK